MTKKKLLSMFRTIRPVLTWSAIAKCLVILLILSLSLITWIYRDNIFLALLSDNLPNKTALSLSSDGRSAINNVLSKSELIDGIGIVSVNFQQNSRKIIYIETKNKEFDRLHSEYVLSHPSIDQPLFNDNQENNQRIIRMINGDFFCFKYDNTISHKYAPGVKIDTVCTIGIPPYYGEFRGFIIAYLQVEPTLTEIDEVRLMVRELSIRLDKPK